MQIEFMLSPLAQCVFLALALIGCLALCVSIKLEIAAVRSSFRKSRDSVMASNATLANELATLRQEIGGAEMAVSIRQELTVTRRTQALRMQNSGQSAAAIAAALRAPRNEIELLLKLRKLSSDCGGTADSGRLTKPA